MKNHSVFFTLISISALGLLFTACDKESFCSGRGTLTVSNSSDFTVHQVIVDGAIYATLFPGTSKDIELAAGKYTVEFIGVNGAGGCYPSLVTIDACGQEWRGCDY